ncbi:hypothetical protein TWF694_008490 [Orbilia ellipsospora]|uniref:Ryanodine receptor Ryr domain-containing protein n=1 Tax=Orbilia ellipsospora TaxID=2528407 RepID=A0AAV9XJP1_9PEZI
MAPTSVILAGEAPVDILIYPSNPWYPSDPPRSGYTLHTCRQRSGIYLVSRFLRWVPHDSNLKIHELISNDDAEKIFQEPVRSILEFEMKEEHHHSEKLTLNRRRQLDYRSFCLCPPLPSNAGVDENKYVVIFQDAGASFSNSDDAVAFLTKARPSTLIYNMTRPLASGDSWESIRKGVFTENGGQDPTKLVVIVNADDLRAEGIHLSHGLSWEKTCEDFVEQLGSVGRLVGLVTCAHLVVLFGCDGVIYHRGLIHKTNQGEHIHHPILYYDTGCTEGEFLRQKKDDPPGILEAFLAGLISTIDSLALEDCIELGFLAARRHVTSGVSLSSNEPDYNPSYIMGGYVYYKQTFRLRIPSDIIGSGADHDWSILDRTVGDPAQIARDIVRSGISSPGFIDIPRAQFGQLVLVDRHEIESFRTVANVLRDYINFPQTKPISIAFFGPRGSGRTYAALELGTALLSDQKVSRLHLDLTQTMTPADLIPIFHSIRDSNLEGLFPLVYITGFDVNVPGSQIMWLSHLLGPIRNGSFVDNGTTRPLGRAIFFFGSLNYKTFQKFQTQTAGRCEEFLGCLQGYINMLGPDCVGEQDRLYPVRRAVILRRLLEVREPKLSISGQLSIDESVLDGLLLIPSYRQGIRSLKSIIAMSRLDGRKSFERAALPPVDQLGLHVDQKLFMRYLNGQVLPDSIREHLAEHIHATYLIKRFSMGMTPEERQRPAHQSWNHLPEEFRESARAHADDVPRKLRLIYCFLAESQDHMHREPVTSFTPYEQDILAEQEHNRWNAERLQKQWSRSSDNSVGSTVRTSPFLVAWSDLAPEWQDVDRVLVASYPRILPNEWRIYRIGSIIS